MTKAKKGSKAWGDQLRAEGKHLQQQIDESYMKLAEVLYSAYDTPIDGDPKKPAIWTQWGHKSWYDWADNELGIHSRKADYLRRIYFRLVVDLKEMPDDVRKRIVDCGWSKAKELCRVLTIENAKEWAEKAEKNSVNALRVLIQQSVYEKQKAIVEAWQAKEEAKAKGDLSFIGQDEPEPKADLMQPILKLPQKFSLEKEQFDIVQQALERAGQIANVPDILTNDKLRAKMLTMICTDFLATNDFKLGDKADKQTFLAKYEKIIGYRIVAIDPDNNEVVYGVSSLQKLAEEDEG